MSVSDARAVPAQSLVTPDDCVVMLIDHQPQMFFGTSSSDRSAIINAAVALAKSANAFNVPVILTTVMAKTFSGPLLPPLAEVFPDVDPIDRTNMNAWEDERVVEAVRATGRPKLVIAGLWTEVCVAFPALSAIQQGFAVYAVTDACGGVSEEAHRNAVERMLQDGVAPLTWLTFLLELQRDWAREESYPLVARIVQEHGGAYGLGIEYAYAMTRPQSTASLG
jgi:nicotinamidase-related amidase